MSTKETIHESRDQKTYPFPPVCRITVTSFGATFSMAPTATARRSVLTFLSDSKSPVCMYAMVDPSGHVRKPMAVLTCEEDVSDSMNVCYLLFERRDHFVDRFSEVDARDQLDAVIQRDLGSFKRQWTVGCASNPGEGGGGRIASSLIEDRPARDSRCSENQCMRHSCGRNYDW